MHALLEIQRRVLIGVEASRCSTPEDGDFCFIFSSGATHKTFSERLITG